MKSTKKYTLSVPFQPLLKTVIDEHVYRHYLDRDASQQPQYSTNKYITVVTET